MRVKNRATVTFRYALTLNCLIVDLSDFKRPRKPSARLVEAGAASAALRASGAGRRPPVLRQLPPPSVAAVAAPLHPPPPPAAPGAAAAPPPLAAPSLAAAAAAAPRARPVLDGSQVFAALQSAQAGARVDGSLAAHSGSSDAGEGAEGDEEGGGSGAPGGAGRRRLVVPRAHLPGAEVTAAAALSRRKRETYEGAMNIIRKQVISASAHPDLSL